MNSAGEAKRVAVTGDMAGEVFPLAGAEVTLGRDSSNTICLPAPSLSRRHCAIVRDRDSWEVRDLGSSNCTS